MRITGKILLVAALTALPGQVVTGALAGAAGASTGEAAAPPLAVVTGALPAAASRSAPAHVYLFGEPDETHAKLGQVLSEPVLSSSLITAGSAFRLAMPDTPAARSLAAAGAGTANIRVVAVSPEGVSSWFAQIKASQPAEATSSPVSRIGTLPAYDLAALRKSAAINGVTPDELVAGTAKRCVHDCTNCSWKTIKKKFNHITRIDEVHAAEGVTATFSYQEKADSTFTVGFEVAGESGWSADGTAGVTNSGGGGASDPLNGYYSRYWESKYDYAMLQQYKPSGPGECPTAGDRKQNATKWDGTILSGNKVAGRKGSSCKGAVEYVTINGGQASNWKDKGHSYFWKTGVSTPMGFSFGDRTGYSSTTKELWKNHRSTRSYLCGRGNDTSTFDQWDIVYNYNSR
jgi:hypothetical protein